MPKQEALSLWPGPAAETRPDRLWEENAMRASSFTFIRTVPAAVSAIAIAFAASAQAQEVEEITSRGSVISTNGLKQERWKSESGKNHN